MIRLTTGDILSANTEAIVNTVNCVGVMGRGIALQFRRAFPENFKTYKIACDQNELKPGKMLVFPVGFLNNPHYIINFPTKIHWKGNSKIEYIDLGLVALIEEIRRLGIHSVALPPLGCGLGGLDWNIVRPRIENAFSALPDLEVLLFEPEGAPSHVKFVKETKRPNMTAGRAILLGLMKQYLNALMDDSVSLLEIHKLMYFMQESGQDLRLNYQKATYGPYAKNLRHAMSAIDGHLVSGYGDAEDVPTKQISILEGASKQASYWLNEAPEAQQKLERVADLMNGYETSFGMELLATVHWVATRENANTPEEAIAKIYAWSDRKRMFHERHIRIAWNTLSEKRWISKSV